jgi:hypothetical protein
LEYRRQVILDVIAGKPQHSQSFSPEARITVRIVRLSFRREVMFAINFHDELRLSTVEIEDVGAQRMLASELESIDLPVSQVLPKLVFKRIT